MDLPYCLLEPTDIATRSSLFRQQLFMKHTNWINQCCDDLMKNPEFSSDQLLKRYIDVQVLAQKSAEVFNGNLPRHTHSPSNGEGRLQARIQELDNEFCLFQGMKYEHREHRSNTCELPGCTILFNRSGFCCLLLTAGIQKALMYLN